MGFESEPHHLHQRNDQNITSNHILKSTHKTLEISENVEHMTKRTFTIPGTKIDLQVGNYQQTD